MEMKDIYLKIMSNIQSNTKKESSSGCSGIVPTFLIQVIQNIVNAKLKIVPGFKSVRCCKFPQRERFKFNSLNFVGGFVH